jgi:menaquinone-dependent protoporphyrinogen oxidase
MTVPARVLIAYHTVEGQTAKIAERIADHLRQSGDLVETCSVDDAPAFDPYDVVVVGDSIHAVHHSRQLVRLLCDRADDLAAKECALFQVSLTSANPDEEHTATAHGMVDELLDRTGFRPALVALFAGALVYTRYGWLKRRVMRSIVRREGGDTDMTRDFEYTDWDAVDAFARDVHSLAIVAATSRGDER